MKKFFLTYAAAVLLLAAFGLLAACSGSFVDPGWASETSGGGLSGGDWDIDGGGGDNDGGSGGNGNGGGGKPAKLSDSATYNQAVAKLDEIIAYCGDEQALALIKNGADSAKESIKLVGSSGWSPPISTQIIKSINALIDSLP
jgi:hypothetical protein